MKIHNVGKSKFYAILIHYLPDGFFLCNCEVMVRSGIVDWNGRAMYFITPACKVSPRVYRHAHMCLESQCIHGPGVYSLYGSLLLLVLVHQVR